MLKEYSIAKARDHFTALVRDVERKAVIKLTRRGKPVAVLLSVQEYERLAANRPGFWEAYTRFRDKHNLAVLDIQPEIFTGLRDTSPGREVNW
jgi:prevent-host-death family protein